MMLAMILAMMLAHILAMILAAHRWRPARTRDALSLTGRRLAEERGTAGWSSAPAPRRTHGLAATREPAGLHLAAAPGGGRLYRARTLASGPGRPEISSPRDFHVRCTPQCEHATGSL